jgi:hypothetical protein
MSVSQFAKIFAGFANASAAYLADRGAAITYADPHETETHDLADVIVGRRETEEVFREDGRELRTVCEVTVQRGPVHYFATRLPAIGGVVTIEGEAWAVDGLVASSSTHCRAKLVLRSVAEQSRGGYRKR